MENGKLFALSNTMENPILSMDEISFFKRNGYLVKRKILEPSLMNKAKERCRKEMPSHFHPDDPSSWLGITTTTRVHDKDKGRITDQGGRVMLRECLHTEALLLNLMPRNPVVWEVIEQLLGPTNAQIPSHVRGMYLTFPTPDPQPKFGHMDRSKHKMNPKLLTAIGYIDDVQPGGGGLFVWPKSHLFMYHAFKERWDSNRRWFYRKLMQLLNFTKRVELSGNAGDVIFIHHRLIHKASINQNEHIRYAVLCDFKTRNIKEIAWKRPKLNMWSDWNI